MARNLDAAALRALVAVAEMGGVTRAAAQLNLTQSAVSVQLKRLEEMLDCCLTEKAGRGVALTVEGEQLVGYARRLLALNDEIVVRMTAGAVSDEVRLGAPCDILNLHLPQVLRAFAERHPEVKVILQSEVSAVLRQKCDAGELDLILTTEIEPGPGAEALAVMPLLWLGAPGGSAWRRRPLPLAIVHGCAYSRETIKLLSAAGFDWEIAVNGTKIVVDGTVAADMAVYMTLSGTVAPGFEAIAHDGALLSLPEFSINMYRTSGPRRRQAELLAAGFRRAFADPASIAAE